MAESYLNKSLSDFVSSEDVDELSHYNSSLLELLDDNIEFPISNLFENDYLAEIKSLASECTLTDEEYYRYRYKPQFLSIVLYGTSELYFLILAINDMLSKKDFDQRTILLLSQADMISVCNMIMNANIDYIDDNRSRLSDSSSTE